MKPHLWRRSWAGRYLRHVPRIKHLRGSWLHRRFGDRLLDEHLWRFDRHGSALGLAIGAFFSVLPMPLQSIPAVILALVCRANIPLALVGCWITNPLTMPLFIYLQLKIGSVLLGRDSLMQQWQDESLVEILKAAPGVLVVGGLALGVVIGLLTYVVSLLTFDAIMAWIHRSSRKPNSRPGPPAKADRLQPHEDRR